MRCINTITMVMVTTPRFMSTVVYGTKNVVRFWNMFENPTTYSRSFRQYYDGNYNVYIVYAFCMTQEVWATKVACDSRKHTSYRLNRLQAARKCCPYYLALYLSCNIFTALQVEKRCCTYFQPCCNWYNMLHKVSELLLLCATCCPTFQHGW